MSANRDIVTDAFRSWADGTGYVGSIFADDMTLGNRRPIGRIQEVRQYPPVHG